jgi:hypothetical protein
MVFEATLFLGQDQSPDSDRKRVAVKFDAGKLSKGSDSRYHARNPFARGPLRILILISLGPSGTVQIAWSGGGCAPAAVVK